MTTVLNDGRERSRTAAPAPVAVVGVAMCWITLALVADTQATLWQQRGLGVVTWLVLGWVLWRETALVRVQTGIVVVFASAIEYTFSPFLEVYTYRFDNVPAYVPPGHGLVYLAALAIGRLAFVRARTGLLTGVVLVVGGAWAVAGLADHARPDVLGAFWFLCLAGFLLWGPSRGLYIGAFVVVSYLELVGTALGTWEWQPRDPTGLVSIGNPPSGAAGGYGWFDLAAVLGAPAVLARWRRWRAATPGKPGQPGQRRSSVSSTSSMSSMSSTSVSSSPRGSRPT